MPDIVTYGEAVFATAAARDRAMELIDDFMEATTGTLEYGEWPNYAAGCELVTQLHIDESDGPGLRWCHRIPQDLSMQFGEIINEIDTLALTYNTGSDSLPD